MVHTMTNLDHTLTLSMKRGDYVYYWDYIEGAVTKKLVNHPEIRVLAFARNAREAHRAIIKDCSGV